jgi:hypothetical protein
MSPADYKAALDAAHTEIGELLQQRTKLDDRLTQLKNTVDALSLLLKDTTPAVDDGFSKAYGQLVGVEGLAAPGAGDMGISDAIRQILCGSQVPMSPTGIRNELAKRGFSLATYANPLAVIHNTLKRLMAQGEIFGLRDRAQQVVAYARKTVPPPPGSHDPIEDALKQAFEGPIPNPGVEDALHRESWRGPRLGAPDPLNQHGKKK